MLTKFGVAFKLAVEAFAQFAMSVVGRVCGHTLDAGRVLGHPEFVFLLKNFQRLKFIQYSN